MCDDRNDKEMRKYMNDLFISKIHIEKCRHLRNIDIELSGSERKHLILTGKNGSGKTSLVKLLDYYLRALHWEHDTETISLHLTSCQEDKAFDIEYGDVYKNNEGHKKYMAMNPADRQSALKKISKFVDEMGQ